MKGLLLYIGLLISFCANSTTYFVSNTGSDANNGTSTGTPWQTISKVNGFAFQPGDIVSFNGGQTFVGPLIINRSGASGNVITYNSYGTGNAIISGFQSVPSWTLLSGGIYESTISAAQSTLMMVTLDGAFQPIGRFPKLAAASHGYLTFQSSSGNTSITSNAISSTPSYVGGQVVIRKNHWILDVGVVTAQTSTTVTYSGGGYTATNGNGFFFQNHINALTALGDWMYESSTKKVRMFFGGGGPGSHVVQVATVQNLVTIASRSFITFSGINFVGANGNIFSLSGTTNNIKVLNCGKRFAGVNGVDAVATVNAVTLTGCDTHICNNKWVNGANSKNWVITDNATDSTGMIPGMGGSGDGTYFGTSDLGDNSLVQHNSITNTGYVVLNFSGSNGNGNSVIVRDNFIRTYCVVKDDGGAIYTGNVAGPSAYTQRTVAKNIIDNGVGASDGAGGGTTFFSVFGIYMDDNAADVRIDSNSIGNTAGAAIYLHNARNLELHSNTTFGSGNEELLMANDNASEAFRGLNMSRNIWFNKTTNGQFYCILMRSASVDVTQWGTWDSSYYCRPNNGETGAFFLRQTPNADLLTNLAGWKSASGKDAHSKVTPITITDPSKERWEYNASNVAVVRSLGGNNYMDVKGTTYSGSITLQPYSSAVLMQVGTANSLPVVSAGVDKTITLPTSSVSVTGTATDADGTITGVQWTRLTGGTATFSDATSNTTTISNLVAGIYSIQFCGTDNSGATVCDQMTITVNPAPNIAPVANAGPDRIIQLPTQTTSLAGSGTDADGTISAYSWTFISGPSTPTIVSASQGPTVVNNLSSVGVYLLRLKVTDNSGGTATDDVTVTVNAVNQAPTVTAGSNQTITLPTNSVTLIGSATDADGTISNVTWTKISGPVTFTIGSPNATTTNVTNLVQGVYVFQLTGTDNQGASSSSTVQVTVNAAIPPNQPPVVNAGVDRAITLPTNSITQVGSATDPDGTISSYSWTKVSGPVGITFGSANAAGTTINNLVAGTYVIQLQATDNQGGIGTDQFTLIVSARPNTNPTVNAGADKTVQLPATTTNFTGTAASTNPGGSITIVLWTQIGGTASTITPTNNLNTAISGLTTPGSRTYKLLVTDNLGLTASDTIIVLVNAAPNQSPVVNAGTDKTLQLPTNFTSLNATASDPDGTISGIAWTKISGPASFSLSSTTQLNTNVTNLTTGVYQFQIQVTDNSGATARDTVKITVNAANVPPTVSAGTNQTITLPTNSVTLTATASDADGTIASYSWLKVSGPAGGTITTPAAFQTSVTGYTNPGTYSYSVTVTDNQGATATSVVQVVVNASPPPNQPPVVNAGADKLITLPTNSVNLSGSATDADGTVQSYQWTKISGPVSFTFGTPNAAGTALTNLTNGLYILQLQATDNQGGIGTDQVTVQVNKPPNVPPIPNAGTDQIVQLPTTTTNLAGSATDPDGVIVSHIWSALAANPAAVSFGNVNSYTSSVSNLTVPGSYYIILTVVDDSSVTVRDTMIILVNAIPNQAPVANAGVSQVITLPTATTTIDASASTDPDGNPLTYLWTKVSGPLSYIIASSTQARTLVSNLVSGKYVFNVRVSDNLGLFSNDTMTVEVDTLFVPPPPVWVPPVSNAGADRKATITILNNTASLTVTGSGTSTYGTIQGYQWTYVSGPTQYVINSPNTASTIIRNLVRGTYFFQLRVTDNKGYIGFDTIKIVVTKQYLVFSGHRWIVVER